MTLDAEHAARRGGLRSAGFEGGLGVMIRSAIDAMYDWQRKAELAESRATRAEQLADALAWQLDTVTGYLASANELLRPGDIDEECAEADEVIRDAREALARHAQHAAARRGE